MGAYLDKPITEKETETGEGNGVLWASSAMQGWRTGMEDAHITLASLNDDLSALSLFGVFDGHGGKEVAIFCKDQLPSAFAKLMVPSQGSKDARLPQGGSDLAQAIGVALTQSFLQMDEMLRMPEHYKPAFPKKFGADQGASERKPKVLQMMEDKLKERIDADMSRVGQASSAAREENARLGMKIDMLKKLSTLNVAEDVADPSGPAASTGCTAVCVVVTPDHMICANAGDSRAVLCRAGEAVPLSKDHKPNNPGERQRIEAAGGGVDVQQIGNTGRVQYRARPSGLSLSRAIGDLVGKARSDLPPETQVISAFPDLHRGVRAPEEDEFIIVACDGIWDVKSSTEACDFVRARLLEGMELPSIIEDLLDACMCKDPKATHGIGADNMTCVVVLLQPPQSFKRPAPAGGEKACCGVM